MPLTSHTIPVTDVTVETERHESLSALDYVIVTAVFGADVDRPNSHGIAVRPDLADRLKRAMLAGVVFTDHEIRTDVNGATYVGYTTNVLSKYANADLMRLGF